MADVNIQNSPQSTPPAPGRGSGAVWAIVAVVLLFLLAWFFFFRGNDGGTVRGDNTPAASTDAGAGGAGGAAGGTGGSGGTSTTP